jgi:ATP-dependent Clp protease protease subunit
MMMSPLLKLFAANRRKGFFRAEASSDGDSDTIYLYDMIVSSDAEAEFWGGVSPEAFIKTLNSVTAPVIHLRVNSPGGSIFAARSMEQAMREHKSQIIAHVDGWAASAASFLIMGADERVAAPGSFIMIHKGWTIAWGNSDDMLKVADLLEQIDASLVKTYAAHTGQSAEDILAWMAEETWFEADRAAELGFVDRVASTEKKEKLQARAQWDLSAYAHAPHVQTSAQPAHPQPDRTALARAVAVKLLSA